MNPIAAIERTLGCMPQGIPFGDSRFAVIRRILVRTGIALIVPSVPFFALAMLGVVQVDVVAIGDNSGLRTIASVAVLGCLMAAIGYWDDQERS